MSDGYHSVNPFIFVAGAQQFVDFLREVFAGVETERITRPDGTIGHAEVRIGDSVVMVSEAGGDFPAVRCAHYVFVDDVDVTHERALAAGATSLRSPLDQFYGNREAGIRDRFGNIWWIATVIEQLPAEEVQWRWERSRQEQDGGLA